MDPTELQASGRALAPHGHGRWHRLAEPPVMFTALAIVAIAAIWATTFNLAAQRQESAERDAAALAADEADTYEAHVVRALREIDQTLKLVRHGLATQGGQQALANLRAEGLLPPEQLFTVTVADASGEVVASTHDAAPATRDTGAHASRRPNAGIMVSRPRRDDQSGEWILHFSRALDGDGRGFAGTVAVSVHAGYFVSGYERAVLGENAVVGLVGTDGVFRARRTGDRVSAGQTVDYDALVGASGSGRARSAADADGAVLAIHTWDGVARYTVARKLFEFPVAIVVGLSRDEQVAPALTQKHRYFRRAGAASVALLGLLAMLGRLSAQLRRERTRVMDERLAHAQRTEHLAFHDNLTDLPNRAFFSRLLQQHTQRAGVHVALLFLDLDRFKTINDSLGHHVGDELLREVARRLRASVRDSDIVARLGGDEFIVLLPEIGSDADISPVAHKVLAAIGQPFALAGQQFRMTVSIGITVCPTDGEDEQTLMKNADVAMYQAKELGRNNFCFYSEALASNALERLTLESRLRDALERDELRLFYAVRRDTASEDVIGTEVVLRWQHPDLGLVEPMQFIPLAEETGLVVPIGRWMIRQACERNAAWCEEGLGPMAMALTLSARQFFDESLLDDVDRALNDSGMEPHLLELKVAEGVILGDAIRAIQIVEELQGLGIRVGVVDFGAGAAAITKLGRSPLDSIAIDRSLVRDAARGDDDGLMDAVVPLGRKLGSGLVAEGVETERQLTFLRRQGRKRVQAYCDGAWVPAEELAPILRAHAAAGGDGTCD